jgi:hypothetical protein
MPSAHPDLYPSEAVSAFALGLTSVSKISQSFRSPRGKLELLLLVSIPAHQSGMLTDTRDRPSHRTPTQNRHLLGENEEVRAVPLFTNVSPIWVVEGCPWNRPEQSRRSRACRKTANRASSCSNQVERPGRSSRTTAKTRRREDAKTRRREDAKTRRREDAKTRRREDAKIFGVGNSQRRRTAAPAIRPRPRSARATPARCTLHAAPPRSRKYVLLPGSCETSIAQGRPASTPLASAIRAANWQAAKDVWSRGWAASGSPKMPHCRRRSR